MLRRNILHCDKGKRRARPLQGAARPMLVQLVLVYCLAAEPSRCVEQRPVPEQPGLGLTACMAGAQPAAARWLADRPDYVLARVRCEVGGKATERGV